MPPDRDATRAPSASFLLLLLTHSRPVRLAKRKQVVETRYRDERKSRMPANVQDLLREVNRGGIDVRGATCAAPPGESRALRTARCAAAVPDDTRLPHRRIDGALAVPETIVHVQHIAVPAQTKE